MKALLAAAVCGAMMTTAALADGPTLPTGTNWSGGYFGAHAGYGQGDSSITENLPTFGAVLPAALATTHDADGYIGGLQVGARRQVGQFVLGVELSGSGGTMPLPVKRTMTPDGMAEASAWVPTEAERKLLRLPNCFISVVLMTHDDGSQSMSLRVGTAEIVPDKVQ